MASLEKTISLFHEQNLALDHRSCPQCWFCHLSQLYSPLGWESPGPHHHNYQRRQRQEYPKSQKQHCYAWDCNLFTGYFYPNSVPKSPVFIGISSNGHEKRLLSQVYEKRYVLFRTV